MKYKGSKRRVAKYIIPIILEHRINVNHLFVEPFIGGVNIANKIKGNVWGNDMNKYLIALYKKLQEGWSPPTIDKITSFFYKDVRDNKDKYEPHIVGYIGFAYGFGATFFGGFVGDCKKTTNRDRIGESYRNIIKTQTEISHINFTCMSYLDMDIPTGSIIYCDPPYKGVSGYKGTDSFNHTLFWNWCREQHKNGSYVYVSEYSAPTDFISVWEKPLKVTVSKGDNKTERVEKLFIFSEQNKTNKVMLSKSKIKISTNNAIDKDWYYLDFLIQFAQDDDTKYKVFVERFFNSFKNNRTPQLDEAKRNNKNTIVINGINYNRSVIVKFMKTITPNRDIINKFIHQLDVYYK